MRRFFWLAESSSRSGYADVDLLHVQARIENAASIASVNKSRDATALEVPSVPKRTTCCHQTSHVSFRWFESADTNLARPRACTKQKAVVSPGQARVGCRWFRASVFKFERVPSRNSRPYLQQTVSGSSSHCCQVFGLLHHTEPRRQRRSRNCGHRYCEENINIFTCMDHRYMYPKK